MDGAEEERRFHNQVSEDAVCQCDRLLKFRLPFRVGGRLQRFPWPPRCPNRKDEAGGDTESRTKAAEIDLGAGTWLVH